MLTNLIREFLDESIQLELNVSDLYQLFYSKFPEDSEFWWQISLEEINHAALIRSINDLFLPDNILPQGVIQTQSSELHQVNRSIRDRISNYKLNSPSRFEAFSYAYEIENSAGELHYELFMNENPVSNVEKIFQRLNGEDKNHALRIDNYMKMNNIVKTGV
jgi:hypothetical protein